MPEAVAPIAQLMSSYPAQWALCGGYAVDAWLGETTREHGDVDIVAFVQDQRMLFTHLRGWQLVPHDGPRVTGGSAELWDGRPLGVPGHLHGRPPEASGPMPESLVLTAEQGFGLDIQLCERRAGEWVLRHGPLITVPLRRAVRPSAWGVPTVVPEVLLFYKAMDLRRRDRLDFAALAPLLAHGQRAWLRDAIAAVGHPWLGELAGTGGGGGSMVRAAHVRSSAP